MSHGADCPECGRTNYGGGQCCDSREKIVNAPLQIYVGDPPGSIGSGGTGSPSDVRCKHCGGTSDVLHDQYCRGFGDDTGRYRFISTDDKLAAQAFVSGLLIAGFKPQDGDAVLYDEDQLYGAYLEGLIRRDPLINELYGRISHLVALEMKLQSKIIGLESDLDRLKSEISWFKTAPRDHWPEDMSDWAMRVLP